MKVLMGLGKLLTVAFWAVVVGNWLNPVTQPFANLLSVAGGLVLLIHVLELWWFNARIKHSGSPLIARLQVLLFGVFHALALAPAPAPVAAADAATEVDDPAVDTAALAEPSVDETGQLQLTLPISPAKEPEHA